MKFWEAMKALQEGRRVRVKGTLWSNKNKYISKASGLNYPGGMHCDLKVWVYDEWEIYKEPKKVKMIFCIPKGSYISEGGNLTVNTNLSGSWYPKESVPYGFNQTDWTKEVEVME